MGKARRYFSYISFYTYIRSRKVSPNCQREIRLIRVKSSVRPLLRRVIVHVYEIRKPPRPTMFHAIFSLMKRIFFFSKRLKSVTSATDNNNGHSNDVIMHANYPSSSRCIPRARSSLTYQARLLTTVYIHLLACSRAMTRKESESVQ